MFFFIYVCVQVIAACTVLHNICLGVGDIIPPEDNQEEEEDNVEVYNPGEAVSGAAWHLRLCNQVSALQDVNQDHDYIIHPNWKCEVEHFLITG